MIRAREPRRMQRPDARSRSDARVRSGGDARDGESGRRGGVRARLGRVFSLRTFLLALALSAAGLVAARSVPVLGALPVVGDAAGYVGVFLAGFAVGAVTAGRHYVEAALAGAVAAGLGAVLSSLLLTVATDVGTAFAAVGATGGAAAALVGTYLGNDLRDGLTRPVK